MVSSREQAQISDFSLSQRLWNTDRRRLMSHILTGTIETGTIDQAQFFDYFKGILSSQSSCHILDSNCPSDRTILHYIDLDFILDFLADKKSSSPGPDGMTSDILVPLAKELQVLLNWCLRCKKIPDRWRKSKTALLPKKRSNRPQDYRPITVSSLMYRCLTASINAHLGSIIKLSQFQKGFVDHDGVCEAITMIDYVVKNHPNARIASLDVSKAFDSISQESIFLACRNKGLDFESIEMIQDLYRNCSTFLCMNGWQSNPIGIKRGVKQGDPLSPFLFNLVLDRLLEEANSSGLGVRLSSGRLAALAYADDLLLLAESDRDLQTLIDLTKEFYGSVGLSANSDKSVVYGNANQIHIGESAIGTDDKLNYLGLTISTGKRHRLKRSVLDPFLDKLKKSSLRPNQKLFMLRQHLIPKFLHRLVHEDFTATILKSLDRAIRNCAKDFLHLPDSAASSWFHLSVKNGGLGLPELRFEIPILSFKRLSRLQSSDSWVMKDVTTSSWFKNKLLRIERLLPHHSDNQARLLNDLERIKNFKGQTCFAVAGGLVNRHLRGNSWFSGHLFVSYLRMRSCTIGATGHEPDPVVCRYGCPGQIETLKHILSECTHMDGLKRRRHNLAQKIVVDHLVSTGWVVYTNFRIVALVDTRWQVFVPDIVTVSPDGSHLLVLDVQCSFEDGKYVLNERDLFKREKYSHPAIISAIKIKLFLDGHLPSTHDVYGLIFGDRGAICNVTFNILVSLGMSKSRIGSILDLITKESIMMYNVFRFR